MANVTHEHDRDSLFWAPGTVLLEDCKHTCDDVSIRAWAWTDPQSCLSVHRSGNQIILHPVPTADPNDPLNWASWRKALNYGLVCFYVLITFAELDIGFTAWEQYQEELGFGVGLLNAAAAVNYAG